MKSESKVEDGWPAKQAGPQNGETTEYVARTIDDIILKSLRRGSPDLAAVIEPADDHLVQMPVGTLRRLAASIEQHTLDSLRCAKIEPVQRFVIDDDPAGAILRRDDNGDCVRYLDHLAQVEKLERAICLCTRRKWNLLAALKARGKVIAIANERVKVLKTEAAAQKAVQQ